MATPNGQKIGIALEELGIPYERHLIEIMKGDQKSPEFTAINPHQKIPAIVDPDGPSGGSVSVFESGAILLYLAEKTQRLIPKDPVERLKVIQWLFWQVWMGPTFSQFGYFFVFASEKLEFPINFYTTEAKRLLGAFNKHLEGHDFVVGNEYSIADIAIFPWVDSILQKYPEAGERVGVYEYKNVVEWSRRLNARPAVAKGMKVLAPPLQPS
ncbi:hypothetical protein HDU93_000680, partial [Gonapodya sp. JEL0774]